jgi:hypothetical protein
MANLARVVGRGGSTAVLGLVLLASAAWADSRPKDRNEEGKEGNHRSRVVVVNGPTQAVPVQVVGKVAAQPFQHQFALDWPDGTGLATGSYVVPAGKRLVIEYASMSAYLQPDGQSMFVRIVTTVAGGDAFHNLAVQKQEDYGVLKQFGAAHLVRIYADPGSSVRVSAGRVPFDSTANCAVTLSGHFEDVP